MRQVSGQRAARLSLNWLPLMAGLLALAICLVAMRTWPAATQVLTNQLFDGYQRLLPRQATEPPVVIIDIDEASIAELGQWPWSRRVIATIVDRLHALGAASIGFDIVFSEPDRLSLSRAVDALRERGATVSLPSGTEELDSDASLARALAGANAAVGLALTDEGRESPPKPKAGFAYGGTDPRRYLTRFNGAVRNIDLLQASAAGVGFFSFATSRDNVIRSMPMAAVAGDEIFPALSVETLRIAQGASGFVIRTSDASGQGGGGIPAMVDLRVGELTVPTDADGRMRIYYSGMPNMPVIRAADLVAGRTSAEAAAAIEGRIALIGTSAVGLRDIVATPIASAMPGVNVHAEIIDQIVAGSFLMEPDWADGGTLLATFLSGLILIGVASRSGALLSTAAFLVLSAAFVVVSWLAFARGQYLLDPVGPTLTLLVVFLVLTPLRLALENREKRFVKNAFGRYLAPALVERLANEPRALRLGGETRRVTVLFSDIRGFTTLSEGMDPQALTGLINNILTPLTDVLLKGEATIDKYIGDAIMAFWNAPLDIDAHEEKACRAALAMLDVVEALNRTRPDPIRIGIGLNTGEACVGNLGSAQRFSYSALGDSVNLASRIESLTKFYGVDIAVSEFTRQAVPDFAFLELDLVRVKGRSAPVRLHALLGDETMAVRPEFTSLHQQHDEFLSLYREGSFAAAREKLAALRGVAPPRMDTLYEIYAERLSTLLADPPGAWDGVYVARSK
ncbi:CHASE2 domain-containing protein [Pleomorphomonas sp. NRK KF1]|uniref:CHASE2 domain-containing protein n=1 Tax=Pleomorphomonas sp. NRK KF1 TaxID=2943000 RepID=UPI002043BFEB|nr:adenylate/guanylate cyclase domain-containing protein [Pleomorphomonas sp. NRK KF1]MCM5552909.1 adenylate/guanylate cyclase domain-containing protein [Pleomorphomonas sp. NRK KF1]